MLNIVWAYPDILNLHGDRGNVFALKKVAKMLGVDANIIKVENYNEKIDFENADIILFNVGEVRVMPTVIETLKRQETEIKDYIEKNKIILLIGTSGCIMANKTIKRDGTSFSGLGILNMECKERDDVYGNDLYYKLADDETVEIMANQIQLIDTTLKSDIAFGKIIYGVGNNDKPYFTEGAKYKNVIFTNALGPVLVKNPWYTEKLIRQAMENKGEKVNKVLDENEFDIEKNSFEYIKKFIENKRKDE